MGNFVQLLCIKAVYTRIIVRPKSVMRRNAQVSNADDGRESGESLGVGTAIKGDASGWT